MMAFSWSSVGMCVEGKCLYFPLNTFDGSIEGFSKL